MSEKARRSAIAMLEAARSLAEKGYAVRPPSGPGEHSYRATSLGVLRLTDPATLLVREVMER